MDAKSKLHSWCSRRGLHLDFRNEKTDQSTFKSQAKVDTFDFVGIGEAPTKKSAEKNASQNFLDHLKKTENCQDNKTKRQNNLAISDAKSFLCRWCLINRTTAAYDYSYEGDPHSRVFTCSITLESSPGDVVYKGKASASSKKVANHLVAKKAVKYLLTENLIEPNEVKHIDLSLPEGETLSGHQFESGTPSNPFSVTKAEAFVNTSSATYLSQPEVETHSDHQFKKRTVYNRSVTSVHKSVNTSPALMGSMPSLTGNWSIDTAKDRLLQFLQENKINADFMYSTDCHNLEGYHVAQMRIQVMWVGRFFYGIGHASTREMASKICAFSLVRQLYRENLIEAYSDNPKKEELISTSAKQIDLHVSDAVVADIIELCAEFREEISKLVVNIDGTGSFLLSPQVSDDTEDFTSIDDIVHPRHGVARMNWNPWTSTVIEKNEYNYNVSLRDVSRNLKIAQELKLASVTFKGIQRSRQNLPIFQYKEEILNCIADNPVTIVKGGTGCGKSTQVCQYILDDAIANNIGSHCSVVVIEAQRICATSLAACVARQRSEPIGQSVGYAVPFDSCLPHPHGAILFCTAGSFIRKLENGLTGISHIVVDEIHERNVETDYILIILRFILSNNPSLKVILLSANIDTDLIISYFGGCPQVSAVAETHPVQEYFLEDCIGMINFKIEDSQCKSNFEMDSDEEVLCTFEKSEGALTIAERQPKTEAAVEKQQLTESQLKTEAVVEEQQISKSQLKTEAVFEEQQIAESQLKTEAVVQKQQFCFELIEAIILRVREQQLEGSILVFLPGWSDIKDAIEFFQKSKFCDNFCFLSLHSKQDNEELTEVFMPVPDRITKVILATSIAESAVAIDGVVCVIDSCKTSVLRSQTNSGSRLVTEWASKVSLDQRLAIAGRKKPGFCFRLCTRSRYEKLPATMEPEIFRMPLHNVALSIKHLKLGSIKELLNNAIQPPKIEAIKEAERFLIELNCLDKYKELTPLGTILARLPLDLRLGRMVLMSTLFNCSDHVLKLAANAFMLPDFFTEDPTGKLRHVANERFSDHIAQLHSLSMRKQANRSESSHTTLDSQNAILKIEKQLYSIIENIGLDLTVSYCYENNNFDIVSALLCQGFYPDICIRDNKRKIHFSDGKCGLVSKKTLMNVKDRNFMPPSPIFVYGERNDTQVNVCRNLTMVMPMHLLCFTNCKVAVEEGMVKIDDWLTLRMDLNVAALLMTVRSMIDSTLLKVVEDPTCLHQSRFIKLSDVVSRLCMIDPSNDTISAMSNRDHQRNFYRRPDPRELRFDGQKNSNKGGAPPGVHQNNSGYGRRRGRGRGNFSLINIKSG